MSEARVGAVGSQGGKVLVRIASIVLALLGATACASSPENDDVRGSVAALVQRWSDAAEAGDWDALADTYADAEGFVWIEQGEVRYASRAAILEGLDRVRGMSASVSSEVSNVVVTPLSDGVAAFRADYVAAVSTNQFSFSSRGVLSGVAIKHGDTWRFLQGALSDRPTAQQ
jgi:ketosteroid isomerase-like protein